MNSSPHQNPGESSQFSSEDVSTFFPVVYDTLKDIAHRCLAKGTANDKKHFSTTELVHEAYLRLIDDRQNNWRSRTHFFAVGAKVMRQVLIDKARQRLAQKRGGKLKMHSLEEGILDPNDDEDILAIETALTELEKLDPLQAQIVVMRFYGGMTVEEVAESFGKSKRWVEGEWTLIKAWLRRQIATDEDR